MTTPIIPRRLLFGDPERIRAKLSPDGKFLAFLAPSDGALNVWVGELGRDQFEPVTHEQLRPVAWFEWAHDNQTVLFGRDLTGRENIQLCAVRLAERSVREITSPNDAQVRMLRLRKKVPSHAMFEMNLDNPFFHDLYKLDLATLTVELAAKNEGFGSWFIDHEFNVCAAGAPQLDAGVRLVVRSDNAWRDSLTIDPDDTLNTHVIAVSAEGSALYIITPREANTARLVRFDLVTDQYQVVHEDPDWDVSGIVFHAETAVLQAAIVNKQRIEYVPLDPQFDRDFSAARALHPGQCQLLSRDADDALWLLSFDNEDGIYPHYVFDRRTHTATALFESRPYLRPFPSASSEPFSLTTRDGFTLHGYLTFPPGVPRTNLPAVMLVHGGPWLRDSWGFDPEVQWLANRGYLVVRVNFRGSSGFGKRFSNAGNRQWGAAMHDDLLDTLDHVISLGYADPARVGIFGHSYGGYAALVAATRSPERFRCAVSRSGPTNLNTLLAAIPPFWAAVSRLLHKCVGDPQTEPEFLWSRSPVSRIDQLRIPLLVAHGANDPRCPEAEAEQLIAALRKHGIDHEYILFHDEGHELSRPDNRLRFYAAAETFLTRHLGGRAE